MPPTDRRAFLHSLGAAALAAGLDRAGVGRLPRPAATLDRIGLQLYTVRRALEDALVIGRRDVVVRWLPPAERRSLDGYKRVARLFNRAGAVARDLGLQFAYHNHDFEFARLGGRVPYDVLLAETDPKLVALELDLYWITKGGGKPLAYFARYPGRFHMVHVKDMDKTRARGSAAVGRGVTGFKKIFARSAQAGIKHYFVEHDQPADPFASIEASFNY